MARHLLLRLRAPLIAFGGETVDNYGVTREFPAVSMVTGLLANALGWERSEGALHDRLQARLIMGSRLDAQGSGLTDFQTAQLGKADRAWTTWGAPEGRAGGAATYDSPSLRYRQYRADADVLVALRLEPSEEAPDLDTLAAALARPARPLFIGRKPCIPSLPIHVGSIEAENVLQALCAHPSASDMPQFHAQWPDGEGHAESDRLLELCDERNFTTGVHGGWRHVREALVHLNGLPR